MCAKLQIFVATLGDARPLGLYGAQSLLCAVGLNYRGFRPVSIRPAYLSFRKKAPFLACYPQIWPEQRCVPAAGFYDAAVSGADPVAERPGFLAMLQRIAGKDDCCRMP